MENQQKNNFAQKKIIAIGSDHAGFNLKEILKKFLTEKLGYEVLDQGPADASRVDYPDFAQKVTKQVIEKDIFGVVVCGSGIGISVAANKIKGIRCALCQDNYSAQLAREQLNANVCAFGERVIGQEIALDALKTFLETKFDENNKENQLIQEKLKQLDEKNLQTV
ncbi:Sugar-phosphate isomerase, RpiB/LacA/LacB family [Pseudocohnilembus persalinus]|uniref:Sugar-phosphate isomerase, RpiB/LacA/LacB family n=1 Tax=Pseudocohnilembus persalinus TaxID=266149 RepID=A0A0V0QSN7_PSEPJ|nr:Sugar-phosphate isomerase, RpiB/LacA/LacB family [Pseudocohnilembus persalinus]|eukprot:KRX05040.1 Sugar-phosphate isomerase, RpiB/LacA/LacB family [Pseudocohnilembus persalinus]